MTQLISEPFKALVGAHAHTASTLKALLVVSNTVDRPPIVEIPWPASSANSSSAPVFLAFSP
jgi:hypothetical protein